MEIDLPILIGYLFLFASMILDQYYFSDRCGMLF